MANLESYQLAHPELLTEDTLLRVLRDRCVEVSRLSSTTSKTELVEIFKRVALPLPQRKYDDSTYMGRKLIALRQCRGQAETALTRAAPILSDVPSASKSNGFDPDQGGRTLDRSKPPLAGGGGTESKKIRLSQPPTTMIPSGGTPCEAVRRKSKGTLPEPSGGKKRQKITWP